MRIQDSSQGKNPPPRGGGGDKKRELGKKDPQGARELELELELIQAHIAQKPVLRGEVGYACVAREVSVERGLPQEACLNLLVSVLASKSWLSALSLYVACPHTPIQATGGHNFELDSPVPTANPLQLYEALFTPPEETEHRTRPGGRGPGGVPGGAGSKNRGGHVRVYRGGSSPIAILSVCLSVLSVCLSVCLCVQI